MSAPPTFLASRRQPDQPEGRPRLLTGPRSIRRRCGSAGYAARRLRARSDFARGRIVGIDMSAAAAAPGRGGGLDRRRHQPPAGRTDGTHPGARPWRATRPIQSPGGRRGALRRRPVRHGARHQPSPGRGRRRADRARRASPSRPWSTTRPRWRGRPAGAPRPGAMSPARRRYRSTTSCAPSSKPRRTWYTEPSCRTAISPCPMETRGVVAWWDPRSDRFDVWVSTQSPHDVRTVTARITGVAESKIRVRMGDVGGGFGQKAYLARDEQIVHPGQLPPRAAPQVDRGPTREPRGGHLIACRACHRHRWPPTRTGKYSACGLIISTRSAPIRMAGSAAVLGAVIFTGPYRIPKFVVSSRVGVHQHLLPGSLPRPVAGRDLPPRAGRGQPGPEDGA